MKKIKKGMTLLEIIIAMAISTIIMGVVTTMFVSNSNILQKVDMNSELQLQAQLIEQKLNKIAMSSAGVVDSSPLTLQDGEDETVHHIFEQEGTELYYYTKTKQADQTEVMSQRSVLARYVDSFTSEFDSISLSYDVEFKFTQGAQTETYGLENRIVFRNN